jgi:hypothetical protein
MITTPTNSFAEVYPQLADRLEAELPALGWVDLDFGQIDNEAEEYALPYHLGCVFIDFEDIAWEELGRGVQRGDAIIKVTLARQVMEDTYQKSSQRQAALGHLTQLGEIHQALSHFTGAGFGKLVRVYSRREPGRPGLWVYSQGFKTRLGDEEAVELGGGTVEDLDTTPRGSRGRRSAADSNGYIIP